MRMRVTSAAAAPYLHLTPAMTPAAASAAAVARRRLLLEAGAVRRLLTSSSLPRGGAGDSPAARRSPTGAAAAVAAAAVRTMSAAPVVDGPTNGLNGLTTATNGNINGLNGGLNGVSYASKASSTTALTKPPPQRRIQRPIYVSATKQHTGKTTASLALISGLHRRFDRVGFVKPVGQTCLPVPCPVSGDNNIRMVDKDAVLVKSHFGLNHMNHLEHGGYGAMSPVVIGRGYTRDFVDGKISHSDQLESIRSAYGQVESVSDVVLCEGTGHCAVGSVVGASNARVASEVGADMVLVANGGLGSTFDELELNRILCESHNVPLAGVIVNKVVPSKLEQTRDYLGRALLDRWGVPLLGCIPDRPFLGCPALADLERLFETRLISGGRHRFRHYRVPDINLVTTSLGRFLENVRQKPSRTLYVSHVTRDDIILGFLGEYARLKRHGIPFESALLLCGREHKYDVCPQILDIVRDPELADVPVMIARMSTHDAMERMRNLTPKLNMGDSHRVEIAVEHYEPHIDFELLLERTSSPAPVTAAASAEEESRETAGGLGVEATEPAAAIANAEMVLS